MSLPLQNFSLVLVPVILLVAFPGHIIPCPCRARSPQHRTNFHGRSIAETRTSSNPACSYVSLLRRLHPLPPGNLHEYQRKGVTKFAFRNWLILKDTI